MRLVAASILLIAAAALSSAIAESCSEAVVHCRMQGIRHSDNIEKCAAAGELCKQTGVFHGPYTGRVIRGFTKR
jgi:hypothetical protein